MPNTSHRTSSLYAGLIEKLINLFGHRDTTPFANQASLYGLGFFCLQSKNFDYFFSHHILTASRINDKFVESFLYCTHGVEEIIIQTINVILM